MTSGFRFQVSEFRRALVFLLFSFFSTALISQNFTVSQSSAIQTLLEKYRSYNKKNEFVDGYRVQILFSDVRDDVYKSKSRMYADFPELKSYVEYEQPYYKLRLGDFKTRLEATFYLQQIIVLYPGSFIVKDKIRIKNG